jgi:hypothetical protein
MEDEATYSPHPLSSGAFPRLAGRAMRDFGARPPWRQLDLSQPYRAYQSETLLVPCEAHSTGEPEQPRINDNRARFLQDFSAESLLPGLGAMFPPSANLLIPQG